MWLSSKGRLRLKSPPRRRRSLRMDPRKRRVLLFIALLAFAVCFYGQSGSETSYTSFHQRLGSNTPSYLGTPRVNNIEPANATLGFGAIVAVSHATSPRRKTLLTAANITGLEITIPEQPAWTEEDVKNFRDPIESSITRGSALAWLGHLNALRWFLSTTLETILVLEDDVDWDIHLRTEQIPTVAAAARTLFDQARNSTFTSSDVPLQPSKFLGVSAAGGYWGNTVASNDNDTDWELLYLGHCGDMFPAQIWNNKSSPSYPSRLTFPDLTIPDRENLHHYTREFLDDLDIPEQTRMVHQSVSPLCTFGFALTRRAAEKLLYQYAFKETEGGCQAYDVRILEVCRDLGFKCWTSNPELFHHQDRPSMIASVNDKRPKSKEQQEDEDDEKERIQKEKDKKKQEEQAARAALTDEEKRKYDEEKLKQKKLQEEKDKAEGKIPEKPKKKKVEVVGVDDHGRLIGAAPNIRCGARGVGMFSEDPETLEYLREVVGKQGRCLRDEFAEEMSKWN